jgi:hypothetical protein
MEPLILAWIFFVSVALTLGLMWAFGFLGLQGASRRPCDTALNPSASPCD